MQDALLDQECERLALVVTPLLEALDTLEVGLPAVLTLHRADPAFWRDRVESGAWRSEDMWQYGVYLIDRAGDLLLSGDAEANSGRG